jgi:hypothetical protein
MRLATDGAALVCLYTANGRARLAVAHLECAAPEAGEAVVEGCFAPDFWAQ